MFERGGYSIAGTTKLFVIQFTWVVETLVRMPARSSLVRVSFKDGHLKLRVSVAIAGTRQDVDTIVSLEQHRWLRRSDRA
jgi:hypothetical protein